MEEKEDNTEKKCHPRVMNLAERYPRAKKVEYINFMVSILLFLKKSITIIRREVID